MSHFKKQITARVYSNSGNKPLLDLLDSNCMEILDIGCGAGDNASLIKTRNPACKVWGITKSKAEAILAEKIMEECWVADIEHDLPKEVICQNFDAILLSHILEHLRDPAEILARFVSLLRPGGVVLLAVPNVLVWRQRMNFFLGRFEYEETGIMDDTHLRFFTFDSVSNYLFDSIPELKIICKKTTGSFPLWILRRYVLSTKISTWIDELGCKVLPNLFGSQVLIKAVKEE